MSDGDRGRRRYHGGPQGDESGKVVTIRGLNEELYRRAAALAKTTGRTVGEVMNEAIELVLNVGEAALSPFVKPGEHEGKTIEVSGLEELKISKEDLEGLGEDEKVVFRGLRRLEIEEDVPYRYFEGKVAAIVSCDEVILPKGYPKLKVAARMQGIKDLKIG